MKFQKLFLAIGISTAGLLTISASGAGKQEKPIHVSELMTRRPIGLLGKRLGERLVVEGEMAEHVMLGNPLAIAKMDGHAMATPVAMEISGAEIKKGIHYKLEGYERSAFGGPPGWLNPNAQASFQYHPCFVVTRVMDSRNVKGDSKFHGMTPLIMNATQKDDCAEVTEMLVAAGADIAAVDANGTTALAHAAERKLVRIQEVLKRHGAR